MGSSTARSSPHTAVGCVLPEMRRTCFNRSTSHHAAASDAPMEARNLMRFTYLRRRAVRCFKRCLLYVRRPLLRWHCASMTQPEEGVGRGSCGQPTRGCGQTKPIRLALITRAMQRSWWRTLVRADGKTSYPCSDCRLGNYLGVSSIGIGRPQEVDRVNR